MLGCKREPRLCRAIPHVWPLPTLLIFVLLLGNTSQIAWARKPCDSTCRECEKSCASQKLDCLMHAEEDRTSEVGNCTPRFGRPCRAVARQTFIRARFGCRRDANACRSCCKSPPSGGCVTTTTMPPTTSTTTATAPASTTTSTTATATTTTTAPTSTTFPTCSERLGHCGASSCSGGCVAHQPDNTLECVNTSTCQFPLPCSSDGGCPGGGACFSDGSGHTGCCTSGCACTPASCQGSTTTTTTIPSPCGEQCASCGTCEGICVVAGGTECGHV